MTEDLREKLAEYLPPEAMFLEPAYFDAAIVGICDLRVVYDSSKVIGLLRDQDGMTEEEAVEYFEYNIAGSMGVGYPIYVDLLNDL